jgi:hypothetical protein
MKARLSLSPITLAAASLQDPNPVCILPVEGAGLLADPARNQPEEVVYSLKRHSRLGINPFTIFEHDLVAARTGSGLGLR